LGGGKKSGGGDALIGGEEFPGVHEQAIRIFN